MLEYHVVVESMLLKYKVPTCIHSSNHRTSCSCSFKTILPNHMSQSGYHEMRTHLRESVVLLSPCYQDVVQEKIRNRFVCFIFSTHHEAKIGIFHHYFIF